MNNPFVKLTQNTRKRMKYEITDIAHPANSNLKRIRALRDIPEINVMKGDLGGYVQSEHNLSQEGNCWISGNAWVSGNAQVSGHAQVSGYTWVSGYAKVSGHAQVYGDAKVSGNVHVFGTAKICQSMRIEYGNVTTDLSLKENIGDSIQAQCNLPVLKDDQGQYVFGYKHVIKTDQENVFSSKYDPKFEYEIGKWSEAKNPDLSDKSCTSGLHFSYITYWIGQDCNAVIQVKCYLDDIITVQEGKIRAKKLFVQGVIENACL